MTTTHTNIAIVEGDVYIVSDTIPKHFNVPVYNWNYNQINIFNNDCIEAERHGIRFSEIIASTAKLEGIPRLDRKHFVKPKVDVEEVFVKKIGYETDIFDGDDWDRLEHFKAGYNAKEAEFTREDMENAIHAAFICSRIYGEDVDVNEYVRGYLHGIRPLSLPSSITTDENFNVISVEWD
jgi:hypothetical protein